MNTFRILLLSTLPLSLFIACGPSTPPQEQLTYNITLQQLEPSSASPQVVAPLHVNTAFCQPSNTSISGCTEPYSYPTDAQGKLYNFQLDTGSLGIVIDKSLLPTNAYQLVYNTNNNPIRFEDFEYSSSGNSYSGQWVLANVQFASATAQSWQGQPYIAQTSPLYIRLVDTYCSGQRCRPNDPQSKTITPKGPIVMMGIGFGRMEGFINYTLGNNPNANLLPPGINNPTDINPFLNIKEMQTGDMEQSYSIDLANATVTLGFNNTTGFNTINLAPNSNPNPISNNGSYTHTPIWSGDYTAPNVNIVLTNLPDSTQPGQYLSCTFTGFSLLVDTGIRYTIMESPAFNANSLVQFLPAPIPYMPYSPLTTPSITVKLNEEVKEEYNSDADFINGIPQNTNVSIFLNPNTYSSTSEPPKPTCQTVTSVSPTQLPNTDPNSFLLYNYIAIDPNTYVSPTATPTSVPPQILFGQIPEVSSNSYGYINTGHNAFYAFKYVYDYKHGLLGISPNSTSSSIK